MLAYDGMTALDAVGPAQVLAAMPGARVTWVAAEPGPKRTDAGMAIVAGKSLADVPRPDVVVVPGALDVRPVIKDERVVHDGKIITGAGVSAGIDMALRLVQIVAGDVVAQTVQLAIEYDPAPP